MRVSIYMILFCCLGWLALSGFTCGPTLKNCTQASDCTSNERCDQYGCVPLDTCTSDQDCKAPRTCINQQCKDPNQGCSTDRDCASPRICKSKQCVDPPVTGCQSDNDCTSPRVCKNKQCVAPPTGCQSDNDCTSPRVCKNKQCTTPATGCQSDNDCTSPQICKNKQCTAPSTGCQSDTDCPATSQCQSGACVPRQQGGICRLTPTFGSLSFGEIKVGEKKTRPLALSNTGDGACKLDNISLNNAKGTSGTFTMDTFKPQTINPGQKLELSISFTGKSATGNSTASLEIFSSNILLRSISLSAYIKIDETLPPHGWATAYFNGGFDDAAFIGGCFWKDGSFQAFSQRAFTTGGINLQYGTIQQTNDDGVKWTCTNCTPGNNWPRQSYYELVDMRTTGVRCEGGRGYVYGSFDNDINQEHPTLFTRTDTTTWKPLQDKNNPLNGSPSPTDQLHSFGGQWFLMLQNMLMNFTPQTDGKFGSMSLRFAPTTQNSSTSEFFSSLHIAHQIGLIVGRKRTYTGGSLSYTPSILYNTNNATLPAGVDPRTGTQQSWLRANPPCTTCTPRKGIVIGPKSFLVFVSSQDAKKQPNGIQIWRTDDLGKNWKVVYSNARKDLFSGDLQQLDSKNFFFVAGDGMNAPGINIEGLLVQSTDGGQSFKAVTLAEIKGKPLQKIPSLHALQVSPDKKTVFALGAGTILRWKP